MTEDFVEMNTATNANSIVFGNRHSWTRMLAGGVNDELLESAEAFYTKHGQALAAAIPGARLVLYQDTGHTPHWEHPEQFARDASSRIGGM